MTATSKMDCTNGAGGLHVAFEMGWHSWKLIFGIGGSNPPRLREIKGRDLEALWLEIAKAKKRFGLPEDAPVFSCYEAGRDGFWLHRCLASQGIRNLVVDSSSIQVPRRKRRVKTDRVDGEKLLNLLERHLGGEKKVWSIVQVPKVETEDLRHVHRELETLKKERTKHVNLVKGLLATNGLELGKLDETFLQQLEAFRQWDGQPVGEKLQRRLQREFQRWQLTEAQIEEAEEQRAVLLHTGDDPSVQAARSLHELKGIGPNSAWLFGLEFFGWRDFRNGRQVGALAGLTPMPYQSGATSHEQGISKAGNRRVRWLAIEISWLWLRYQPQSKLSRWYASRFGGGKSRLRRIGIVALARRLLIALWRYVQHGEVPEGAELKDPARKAKRKAKRGAA